MITQEELEVLSEKVTAGTATELEELLYWKTIEKGLDELIEIAEEFPREGSKEEEEQVA